jgi:hypothetical protein
MEHASASFDLFSLLPLLFLSIPYEVAAFWLSPKMGANRWLWLILIMIPLVNIIAGPIFLVLIIGSILDKLNELSGTKERKQA